MSTAHRIERLATIGGLEIWGCQDEMVMFVRVGVFQEVAVKLNMEQIEQLKKLLDSIEYNPLIESDGRL